MSSPTVLSLGTLCYDVIGAVSGDIPTTSITARLAHLKYEDGGRGTNFAIYAAGSGGRPTIIARVGHDFRDSAFWNRLIATGVSVDGLYHQMDTLTPRTFIFSNSDDMTLYFYPAMDDSSHEQGFVAHVERCVKNIDHDAVYCSSELPTANLAGLATTSARLRVFAPAHDAGRHTADQLADALSVSDWLIANEVETAALVATSGRSPEVLVREYGLALFAVTRGSDGTDLHLPGRTVHLEPCRPRVVTDPTGAGDAFAGALVTRYLETGDLIRSARHATALASFVVEEIGCWITMPSAESINERISATWPRSIS